LVSDDAADNGKRRTHQGDRSAFVLAYHR
jgi:hypothetical protein